VRASNPSPSSETTSEIPFPTLQRQRMCTNLRAFSRLPWTTAFQSFSKSEFDCVFFARNAMRPFGKPHHAAHQWRDCIDLARYRCLDFEQGTCASAGKARVKFCSPVRNPRSNHHKRLTPGITARRGPKPGMSQNQAKSLIFCKMACQASAP
jgi:hypothetical protein